MINRRSFFLGALAAPVLVKASSLEMGIPRGGPPLPFPWMWVEPGVISVARGGPYPWHTYVKCSSACVAILPAGADRVKNVHISVPEFGKGIPYVSRRESRFSHVASGRLS